MSYKKKLKNIIFYLKNHVLHNIIMEIPEYDGIESVNKYMKRVEKYKQYILKEKYDVILLFINEWLKKNYESITSFRNISEEILLKNLKHNRDIIRKYCDLFKNKFSLDLTIDLETDSDEINDRYIITLLGKMLNLVDYHIIKRELGTKILYTIRKK